MENRLLGGLSPAQFMRRHWQKSPHLIRLAIPDFGGVVDRKALFALAARDDVESRLVVRESGTKSRWLLEHGPFRASDLRSLPATNWTLLVHGVDLHVNAAAALLQRFSFVPFARLDDLMISYAVEGGGVGPHFDSYDVFLLQATGRRRWRIGLQDDLRVKADAPLKILSHFKPDASWDLDPGDMLYLPPSVAHDGVALTECTTYSIGFRAPTTRELAEGFLQFLPDALQLGDERYADPELRPTNAPAQIDSAMMRRLRATLGAVRWDKVLIERYIGCMLSEPKAGVFFERPQPVLSFGAFVRSSRKGAATVHLDRRVRMLYDTANIFLNGEVFAATREHPALVALADRRQLCTDADLPATTLRLLHQAYLTGALHVGQPDRT